MPLASFAPAGASRAWDLAGPAGPSAALARHVFLTSLEQVSSQFLRNWLGQTAQAVGFTSRLAEAQETRSRLRGLLGAGETPLIALRNGGRGHLVVAVDVEDVDDPSVLYYIHLYDSNEPFKASEEADPAAHETSELTRSRIAVARDGTWRHEGLGWGPFGMHTVSEGLVIVPAASTPLRPTFPASVEGLVTLVFGAAEATQLAGANGRTAIAADGDLDRDPATALAAAPLVLVSGPGGEARGWVVKDGGAITQTLRGTADGSYRATILGDALAAQLGETAITTGAVDELAHDQERQSVTFVTRGGPKPLSLAVVARAPDGSYRSIGLETTTFAGGGQRLRYDRRRDAVVYRHDGEAAPCTLRLGWAGADALPSSFTTRGLELGAGDELVIRPSSWKALDRTPVRAQLRRADGSRDELELAHDPCALRPHVALCVADDHGAAELELDVRLPEVTRWSNLVVSYAVFRKDQAVHHATRTITEALDAPVVERIRLELPPGRYELVVYARAYGHGVPTVIAAAEERLRFELGRGRGKG